MSHASGIEHLRPFLPGLESVLADPDISEVMINGPHVVWIEREGRLLAYPAPDLDGEALMRAAIQICRPLSLDPARTPTIDARLADGSRVAVCVPPASPEVAITVRRFGNRSFSAEDLVEMGSLPPELLEEIRKTLLSRHNVLVSGGTGSGKTTLLNALIELLPEEERVVSIEDTLELRIDHTNAVRFEAGRPRRFPGHDPRPGQARAPAPARPHRCRGGPGSRGRRSAPGAQHRPRRQPHHRPRQQLRGSPATAGELRHDGRGRPSLGSGLPQRSGRDFHGGSHDAAGGAALRRGRHLGRWLLPCQEAFSMEAHPVQARVRAQPSGS